MSRRHRAQKREVLPDPKYKDLTVTKFMNYVMYEGKKAVAENIVYGAFEILADKKKDFEPVADLPHRPGKRRAVGRSPLASRRRRHLSGAGRGSPRSSPRPGHPLAGQRRAQAW